MAQVPLETNVAESVRVDPFIVTLNGKQQANQLDFLALALRCAG